MSKLETLIILCLVSFRQIFIFTPNRVACFNDGELDGTEIRNTFDPTIHTY